MSYILILVIFVILLNWKYLNNNNIILMDSLPLFYNWFITDPMWNTIYMSTKLVVVLIMPWKAQNQIFVKQLTNFFLKRLRNNSWNWKVSIKLCPEKFSIFCKKKNFSMAIGQPNHLLVTDGSRRALIYKTFRRQTR